MDLQRKINHAVTLLQSIPQDKEVEVSFSGGKDSSVILELAKMAGIKYRAIYKLTTVDPKGTTEFCRSQGCEIVMPKQTFFDLIKQRGFPTMRARFCCEVLKEYKVLAIAVQGIRKSESAKRDRLYREPQICRIYGNKGKKKKDGSNYAQIYLPILYWTDKDVEDFIKMRGIQCHQSYYDSNGIFHVERRLGCVTCPLQSDRGLADFVQHPKYVRRYIECGLEWWNKPRKKELMSKKNFGSVYELFVHNLFFNTYEDFRLAKSGMFGHVDCKQFLEDYFKTKLR